MTYKSKDVEYGTLGRRSETMNFSAMRVSSKVRCVESLASTLHGSIKMLEKLVETIKKVGIYTLVTKYM